MTRPIVRTIGRKGCDFALISDALRNLAKGPAGVPVTLVIRVA